MLARVSCVIHVCKATTYHAAALKEDMRLLLYTSVGLAAFLLLSVAGYYCIKCICEYPHSLAFSVQTINRGNLGVVRSFDGFVGDLKTFFVCISARCDKSTQYNVNNPVGAGTEGK